MPQLKDLLHNHLLQQDSSARAFAERTGISYPTVLALLHKGSVPRKPEHREALRRELALEQDDWAGVLAASQRDGIDIPREGPLTLRQLILKALLAQGFTEQSFAKLSGVPYATLMGLTRKGAIPRTETLTVIAEKLGLAPDDVLEAADRSRTERAAEGLGPSGEVVLLEQHASGLGTGSASEALMQPTGEPPFLSQLVADGINASGTSVAAFARTHGLPYISLHRLLVSGQPPHQAAVLEPLAKALGLSPEAFVRSLRRSTETPTPASHPQDETPLTPLQTALQSLVKSRSLTTKAFAELSDLSVLTATKLLKHGDLPGRTSTHEKLRLLLQLSVSDYEDLVRRSRPESAGHGAESLPDGPTLDDLLQLLRSLGPRQRVAVKQFILSLAPGR